MIRNTRDKPQAAMHIKSRGALALGIFTATVTAAILFDDDRYVDANQRTNVAKGLSVGAQNFDLLPLAGEGAGHLSHAAIL